MFVDSSTEKMIARYHFFSKYSAVLTTFIGFAVCIGWIFDIGILKSISSNWVTMKLNTALCLMFLGLTLLLLLNKKPSLVVYSLLWVPIAISSLTLSEYWLDLDLFLDQFFVKETLNSADSAFPGRMSHLTALDILLCSLSLLCFKTIRSNTKVWLTQVLAILVFLSSLDSLFVYAYGVSPLDGIAHYTQNALHTSVTFLVLSIGIFLIKPNVGLASVLTLDSIGGKLARRLLPMATFIPPVLGYLVLQGQHLGFYGSDFQLVIMVTLFILIYSTSLWKTALSLHKIQKNYVFSNQQNQKLLSTNKHLKTMSSYDFLTGLPNRNYCHHLLEHAINRAKRKNTSISILFADIDNFKNINDNFGHEVGDRLLIEVGKRLRLGLRESDILARIGGDEFIIIVEDPVDIKNIETVAKRVNDTLKAPVNINEHILCVTISLGISFFPQDGDNMQILIKNADIAMYHAKKSGKNSHQLYMSEERKSK